jgi:hypothetical protein
MESEAFGDAQRIIAIAPVLMKAILGWAMGGGSGEVFSGSVTFLPFLLMQVYHVFNNGRAGDAQLLPGAGAGR